MGRSAMLSLFSEVVFLLNSHRGNAINYSTGQRLDSYIPANYLSMKATQNSMGRSRYFHSNLSMKSPSYLWLENDLQRKMLMLARQIKEYRRSRRWKPTVYVHLWIKSKLALLTLPFINQWDESATTCPQFHLANNRSPTHFLSCFLFFVFFRLRNGAADRRKNIFKEGMGITVSLSGPSRLQDARKRISFSYTKIKFKKNYHEIFACYLNF